MPLLARHSPLTRTLRRTPAFTQHHLCSAYYSTQDSTTQDLLCRLKEQHGSTIPRSLLMHHLAALHENPQSLFDKLKVEKRIQHHAQNPLLQGLVHLDPVHQTEKTVERELLCLEEHSHETLRTLRLRLAEVTAQLGQLQLEKDRLDAKAVQRLRGIVYGSCAYLSAQMAVFARFTWYDFGWDVIEPVSYFTSFTCIVATYLYFVALRPSEYTYEHASQYLLAKLRGRLYLKHNFDIEQYKVLVEEAHTLQESISHEAMRVHGRVPSEMKAEFFTAGKAPSL